MASPGFDIDWVGVLKWGVPVIFYAGVAWATYKQVVKNQAKDRERIDQLERRVAGGVRRQDIDAMNKRIDTLSETVDKKLDLIIEVVRAQRQ